MIKSLIQMCDHISRVAREMSTGKYFLWVREFLKSPDNFGKTTHFRKNNQPRFVCHRFQVLTFFLPSFAQYRFRLDIKCDYDRMQSGNTDFHTCSHILSIQSGVLCCVIDEISVQIRSAFKASFKTIVTD